MSELTLYKKETAIENQRVGDLSEEDKEIFVLEIIIAMAAQCGGFSHFWRQEDRELVLGGWIKGLEPFRTKRILAVVELILDCKYKKQDAFGREDYVPRTAMDFKYFMVNSQSTYDVQEEKKPTAEIPPPSEEDRRKYAGIIAGLKESFKYKKPEEKIIDKG